jgi:hypothetical protein
MDYLLDNKKVYIILGIVILIWLYCLLSKPKTPINQYIATPIKTNGIVGYEPRYFNTEIYSMPNAKSSPQMLYGSEAHPNPTDSTDSIKLGFERLLPQVDNLQKIGTVSAYAIQEY